MMSETALVAKGSEQNLSTHQLLRFFKHFYSTHKWLK